MIITIDGPAKSGKSKAAELLAQALGYRLLNTGAMYRAVGLVIRDSFPHDFSDPRLDQRYRKRGRGALGECGRAV
jgi:cytidylate kinase